MKRLSMFFTLLFAGAFFGVANAQTDSNDHRLVSLWASYEKALQADIESIRRAEDDARKATVGRGRNVETALRELLKDTAALLAHHRTSRASRNAL